MRMTRLPQKTARGCHRCVVVLRQRESPERHHRSRPESRRWRPRGKVLSCPNPLGSVIVLGDRRSSPRGHQRHWRQGAFQSRHQRLVEAAGSVVGLGNRRPSHRGHQRHWRQGAFQSRHQRLQVAGSVVLLGNRRSSTQGRQWRQGSIQRRPMRSELRWSVVGLGHRRSSPRCSQWRQGGIIKGCQRRS